jgi:hypothetical protein
MFQYALNDAKSVVYIFYFFLAFFCHYGELESDIDDKFYFSKELFDFKTNYFEELRNGIINSKESQKNIKQYNKPTKNIMRLIMLEIYMSVLEYVKVQTKEFYDHVKIELN